MISEKQLKSYVSVINSFIIKNKNITVFEIYKLIKKDNFHLPSEKELKQEFDNPKSTRDKGLVGKIIEYAFFGIKPNPDSKPDLDNGYDIKSCAFKQLKNECKNAKERQTLTNCTDYENLIENEKFENCKYYNKCKKLVLFIRSDDKIKLKTYDQLLNQRLLLVVIVNLDFLPQDILSVINKDYELIRNCVINKKISQAGQKYLHIHKHGSKNSETRAFGYTPKLITRLAAITLAELLNLKYEDIINENGNSLSIPDKFI